MKIKIFPAFLLFMASYFPLSLILLLQDVSEASWNRPFCRSLHDCSLPELVNATRSLRLFGVCMISLVFFLGGRFSHLDLAEDDIFAISKHFDFFFVLNGSCGWLAGR